MTSALSGLRDRRHLALAAALVASIALLLSPSAARSPSGPVPAGVAWPHAQTGTIPASLSDGSAYTPLIFLDAHASIGAAADNSSERRLVRRGADGSVHVLRHLPAALHPSFRDVTASGQESAWLESTDNGAHVSLWAADLSNLRPPHRIALLTPGSIIEADSRSNLLIHGDRLYWVERDPVAADATAVRSVALSGGPVETRTEPGDWRLTSWPWLTNETTGTSGAARLRNMITGQDVTVPPTTGAQTTCSPAWCETVSLSADDSPYLIEVARPDGSGRVRVSSGTAVPATSDVAVLDRFEVLWQTDPNLDLTHNGQLLVFDIDTRRTVELSPNATTLGHHDGVLWWSSGDANRAAVTWHTIDLRTI
jgi:hypothetical protein